MAKNGFRVFDSDMHIMEPPDLWQRYIDPEFRSIAPIGRVLQGFRATPNTHGDATQEW